MVPILDKRGAHMSRLIFPEVVKCESIEQFIDDAKVLIKKKTGVFPYIKMTFRFPWKDQFPTIEVENYIALGNEYTYVMKGITACPCSKEVMGIGHMQKCDLKIKIEPGLPHPKFEEIFKLMEGCFSASLTEKLKRDEEAAKIKEAQDNTKFVEDVVRHAVRGIPNIRYVRAESDESIHSHKAVAWWHKR
jgi:GTP cyclohydrolase FolE2